MIRGFGHVKLASIQRFEKRKNDLLAKWRASASLTHVA
jgi:indolepyruvate ferredoxin oxidoreductase